VRSNALVGADGNHVHTGSHILHVDNEILAVDVVVGVDFLTHGVVNADLVDYTTSLDVDVVGGGVGINVKANFVGLSDSHIGSVEVGGGGSLHHSAVVRIARVVIADDSNHAAAPSFEVGGQSAGDIVSVSAVGVDSEGIAPSVGEGSAASIEVHIVASGATLSCNIAVFENHEGEAGVGIPNLIGETTGNGTAESTGIGVVVQVVEVESDKAGERIDLGEVLGNSANIANTSDGAGFGGIAMITVNHHSGSIGAIGIIEEHVSFVGGAGESVGVETSVVAHPDGVDRSIFKSRMDAIVSSRAVLANSGGEVFEDRSTGDSRSGIISDRACAQSIEFGGRIGDTVGVGNGNSDFIVTGSVGEEGDIVGEVVGAVRLDIDTRDGSGNGSTAIDTVGQVKTGEVLNTHVLHSTGDVKVVIDSSIAGESEGDEVHIVLSRNINLEVVANDEVHVVGVLDNGDIDSLADESIQRTTIFLERGSCGRNVDDCGGECSTAFAVGCGNLHHETIRISRFVAGSFQFKEITAVGYSERIGDEPTVGYTCGIKPRSADHSRSRITKGLVDHPSIALILIVADVVIVEHRPRGRNTI